MAARRLLSCIERWPDCETGEYHPSCCRFPKSCSASVYSADIDPKLLEPERKFPQLEETVISWEEFVAKLEDAKNTGKSWMVHSASWENTIRLSVFEAESGGKHYVSPGLIDMKTGDFYLFTHSMERLLEGMQGGDEDGTAT